MNTQSKLDLEGLFRALGITDFPSMDDLKGKAGNAEDLSEPLKFTKNVPGDDKDSVSVKCKVAGDIGELFVTTENNGTWKAKFNADIYNYAEIKVYVSKGVLTATMPRYEEDEFEVKVEE